MHICVTYVYETKYIQKNIQQHMCRCTTCTVYTVYTYCIYAYYNIILNNVLSGIAKN